MADPADSHEALAFRWNGRVVEGKRGDTIAEALWRAGIRRLGVSRKRHRPLGLSGTYLQGVLVEVDGEPHVRADRRLIRAGLDVRRQNAWPSPAFDVLALLRAVPARWSRNGFEQSRWFPGGSRRFLVWERLLGALAGEVAVAPVGGDDRRPPAGRRLDVDTVIVGGGPAGLEAAAAARQAGRSVVVVTRGRTLATWASDCGARVPPLAPGVTVLPGHDAVALYRGGHLVLAAPIDGPGPATLICARATVLATGRRSIPPAVPGHDLPGVLAAATALRLVARPAVTLGPTVVVGTGCVAQVASLLNARGVDVVDVAAATDVSEVLGRREVNGIVVGGRRLRCHTVVHAGPWRGEPDLAFQAGASGTLRLRGAPQLPEHVRVIGAAAAADEPLVAPVDLDRTPVCPCMDVTAADVAAVVRTDGPHVEIVKRRTSCGMGPCQGFPCWDIAGTLLGAAACGDRPTLRAPRRGLTVEQAAGLDGLVDFEP